jgi:aminoglycoside phosphotransferase family enzyme
VSQTLNANAAVRLDPGQTAAMTQARAAQPPTASAEKAVAFLRRPASYPDRTGKVDVRETHMSWVFLTDRYVYKLKKPVRFSYLDYGTPAARLRNCRAEVRLNRRLAPWVYLAVVPLLRREGDGALSLGGAGQPVDWLVKMVRLPADGLLDEAMAAGPVGPERLDDVARLLADFYRAQPRQDRRPAVYAQSLKRDARDNRDALLEQPGEMSETRVDNLLNSLTGFVDREADLLAKRAARLVEGHGDLRPDHIYLGPPPAVIDCIEFNREFRINDPADELAFLAMECERRGVEWIGRRLLSIYQEVTGDRIPDRLLAFHKAHRALLRAKLSLWHLQEPRVEARKWRRKTEAYLSLAESRAKELG